MKFYTKDYKILLKVRKDIDNNLKKIYNFIKIEGDDMEVKILSENEIPQLQKLKEKFDIFRVLDVKNSSELEAVEFFNKDGVFRGFGKDTQSAFKKAKKVINNFYK